MCQVVRGPADGDSGCGNRGDAAGADRRASPRHTVLDHRGWLGHWGERGFEVVEVSLLDISRGGVAFETDLSLAERQTAVLGLRSLREQWCLEVKAVRVRRGRRMRYRVHAAFTDSCPEAFSSAALYGPEPVGAAAPGAGSGPPPGAIVN